MNIPTFVDHSEAVAQRCSVKKVFLKIAINSQENTSTGDSGTGVFLWIYRNFSEHLFYRTPPVAASGHCILLWFVQFSFFYFYICYSLIWYDITFLRSFLFILNAEIHSQLFTNLNIHSKKNRNFEIDVFAYCTEKHYPTVFFNKLSWWLQQLILVNYS